MTIYQKLALLCIPLLAACSQEPASNPKLQYQISYLGGSDPSLEVKLEAPADPSGITILSYPDQAWGQDSLHNSLGRIELLGEGTIERRRDSGWIVLNHPKDIETVKLNYSLKQDFEGLPGTRDVYRALIDSSYFQLFGHHLLAFPKNLEQEGSFFDVSLDWSGIPEHMAIQNSYGSQQRIQHLKGVDHGFFMESVHFAGDYRIHDIEIEGNIVSLAIRDNWQVFNDSTMVEVLRSTVQAQRDFWKDHSQKYFSVSIIPTAEQRGSSYQGTGLPQAFATAASNNQDLDPEGLVYLFNHELQHKWTGMTLKNENEEEQYWFSEGFTDYYTMKNIARNNIYGLSNEYFIDNFNKSVQSLFLSPVKEAPNSEINYDNFWKSHDYGKLPYYRGAVFAGYLDLLIMRDSKGEKSLDDLMHYLLEHKDTLISNSYFLEVANSFTAQPIDDFFKKHIEDGILYDLNEVYNQFGLEYQPESDVFHIGFEREEFQITSVDPDSNAYKAGLRKGDQLRSLSYEWGRPDLQASLIVLRDNQEIDLKFYPAKTGPIPALSTSQHNLLLFGY